MPAIGIGQDIHSHLHCVLDGAGAKQRIKSSFAHLGLTKNRGLITTFHLDRANTSAQGIVPSLQALRCH